MLGKVDKTEDVTFDSLFKAYQHVQQFAKQQKTEMNAYLEKSRGVCYASIASAEAFQKFYESTASAAAPPRTPLVRTVRKGHQGYGMAIEDDRQISGFSLVSGPAELAGVVPGYRITAVNGKPVFSKADVIQELVMADQRSPTPETEFTMEPPPPSNTGAHPLVKCTSEISQRTQLYARETRGRQEQLLIKEVIEPLNSFMKLLDGLKKELAAREAAREKLGAFPYNP